MDLNFKIHHVFNEKNKLYWSNYFGQDKFSVVEKEGEDDRVQVSKSRSRASSSEGNKDLVIKDATVAITDEESNEVSLIYTEESLSYEALASDLIILPGKKYFLKVIAQGKEFHAVCTIPVAIIENVVTSFRLKTDDNGYIQQNLNVNFEDIKGGNNFYVIGALYTIDGYISQSGIVVDFDMERFATDVNGDGLNISTNGTISDTNKAIEVTIKIANVDELIYATLRASFLNKNQR